MAISPEEIEKLHGANEISPRRPEIKVQKNEMKVRKKDFEVPKNFPVPHWIIKNLHGGILRFPPPVDFFHRDAGELIRNKCVSPA